MFWVIRGTEAKTNEDFAMVVEARSRAAAEAWALKRGLPYIIIDEATDDDVETARQNQRLWRQSRDSRFTCFGRPVAPGQLACLMCAGLATIAVVLHNTRGASIF